MLSKNQILDKVIFLITMMAGMAFLIIMQGHTGVDQTIGIAVTIGGLMGLISAHSLQAVFTMIEKGFLVSSNAIQSANPSSIKSG